MSCRLDNRLWPSLGGREKEVGTPSTPGKGALPLCTPDADCTRSCHPAQARIHVGPRRAALRRGGGTGCGGVKSSGASGPFPSRDRLVKPPQRDGEAPDAPPGPGQIVAASRADWYETSAASRGLTQSPTIWTSMPDPSNSSASRSSERMPTDRITVSAAMRKKRFLRG